MGYQSIVKPGVRPAAIAYMASPDDPAKLRISRRSDLTGRQNSMDLPVTEAMLQDWCHNNKLIQNVMPSLSKDQREFLISGCTPAEWDAMNEED